eukprot:CAMPEP_0178431248 /NCGR_PEP_ID=MMETSP0689_2-20121128/31746_1 /TAXON_ID=160604 /ORGANISM="Amphidinium massartii, Strain CS-259" /LENGTH=169 /DNA_ID=CAMNT_0020053147 /DNA_START=274 /DNA_END=783 /DNA_ORIENTATION=+
MELDEVRQCDQQHGAHEEHHHPQQGLHSEETTEKLRVVDDNPDVHEDVIDTRYLDDGDRGICVKQQLHEELSVVVAYTVVDPWTMVVHVEITAVANATMVNAVRFPNVAHLAIPSPLGLIAHIESPIGWNHARICGDALIEGQHQVDEEEMVDDEDQRCPPCPEVRSKD